MRIWDGLKNVVANLGTARDKASHTHYVDSVMPTPELLAAYRNSWLSRAAVNYPAEDATRKWRMWRAEADQITKIEKVEKELDVKGKVLEALISARLFGGAAIYINTGDAQQDQPLVPGKGEIKSLVVLSSRALSPGEIVRDINSVYYGNPEFFTLTSGATAKQVEIHASRLAIFRGARVPDDMGISGTHSRAWGDSVLQAAYDAIMQADSTMANVASLVFESKVDVFRFEGFADLLASAGGDEVATNRLHTQAAMKGINGAVVIDKNDEYENKSYSFGGLPEIIGKCQDNVAGAVGIPVTRLYGRAAVGLSGSGDGDERVYFDRIGHIQSTEITPAMALLDDCIIWQALGSRPEEIYYEWTPLRQITETEQAEIFVKTATAARSIAGANSGELVPLDALSDALVNALTESGSLPGLDQAVAKYGALSEQNTFIGGES